LNLSLDLLPYPSKGLLLNCFIHRGSKGSPKLLHGFQLGLTGGTLPEMVLNENPFVARGLSVKILFQ
jgi:hypothetical protein